MSFETFAGHEMPAELESNIALHFFGVFQIVARGMVNGDPRGILRDVNGNPIDSVGPTTGAITLTAWAQGWGPGNAGRIVLKRSTSIAQNVLAPRQNNAVPLGDPVFSNQSVLYDTAWGPFDDDVADTNQGQLTTVQGGRVNWDASETATWRAGSNPYDGDSPGGRPRSGFLAWGDDNASYFGELINISATYDPYLNLEGIYVDFFNVY